MESADDVSEVDPGDLVICSKCRQLRGPVPGRTDGAWQSCSCTPVEIHRTSPKWGGDHNTYAEPCRCCGLVLLKSGSKWSVWFCEPCKVAIRAFNQAAGRCIVPIGRHSLMNGVAIDPAAAAGDTAAIAVTDQLGALFKAMGGTEAWAASVIERNEQAFGFDPTLDVTLSTYLDAVERSSLTAEGAIEALLASLE